MTRSNHHVGPTAGCALLFGGWPNVVVTNSKHIKSARGDRVGTQQGCGHEAAFVFRVAIKASSRHLTRQTAPSRDTAAFVPLSRGGLRSCVGRQLQVSVGEIPR